jgi:hypothetical protein
MKIWLTRAELNDAAGSLAYGGTFIRNSQGHRIVWEPRDGGPVKLPKGNIDRSRRLRQAPRIGAVPYRS